METSYDVVIIGAGPVGLATALGLRQRGIDNLLVVEPAQAFRRVGQVVDLPPNGLKALKNLNPQAYEAIKGTLGESRNPPPTNPPQKVENITQTKNSPALSSIWGYKNLQTPGWLPNPHLRDSLFPIGSKKHLGEASGCRRRDKLYDS